MITCMEKCRIKQFARARGITHFVHFTNIENVDSILRCGLLTRLCMDEKQLPYHNNDAYRYDDLQDSISLSIMFPNYKMFYKLRKEQSDTRWAVLFLPAEEVLNYDCVFCKTNAANNEISTIPVCQRKGLSAFQEMFYERQDITRKKLGLPDCYTTDPQAEILVCNNIPPNLIQSISVENVTDLELINNKYININVNVTFFGPRFDYEWWR